MPSGTTFVIAIYILSEFLLIPGSLWAQAESGTIVGTVMDSGGAVLPNAKVTLTNNETQLSRVVACNSSGQYVASSIPTGTYTIAVEEPGFQKLIRSGVTLTAADTLTADLTLTIGSIQETVQVTATAPLVQDQTAAISSLVTNKQILEMPLNGRTFTSLILLSPGAAVGSSNNLASSPYAIRGSTNISVNGSSPQNNAYLIDGVVNRNLWLNTLIMVPTVDSIQEFRVLTSNYSSEYGSAAGAITVVQTKSGTNAYHGSAYEFLRNDKLDANTFFNNRLGAQKPAFRRNEFGATSGGPVRRDRTFFFADYQGIRIRQPQSVTSTIPTLAQRAMVTSGDFSLLGTAVYDPATAHPGPNGTVIRDAFPGNRIPVNRLDPAAIKLLGLLPGPTSSAATRNFIFIPTQGQRTDQFDTRLDQNLGSSDRIFFKYSYDNTFQTNPGLLPSPANAGIPIGPYLSSDANLNATGVPLVNQSVTLNFTKVIGPSAVNESRFGIVRWNEFINPLGSSFDTASKIGIPGININDKSGGLPGFTITGYQVIGDNSTFPEDSHTTSFDYEDVLTLVRGSHTLKFGGSFVRNRFNGFSSFPTRGQFDFNGQFTRQIGTSGSQTALADFALGATDAVTRNVLVGTFGMRFWDLAAFADDSWRVTNRLTLNYGLRYELSAPPYEVHDRWSNFNLNTGQLVIAGGKNGRRLRKFDTGDFAPRLGLTYALTADKRTVVRSGFGISYVEAGQGGGQLYKNLPFYFSQVIATDQNAAPSVLISNGLPSPVAPDPNDIAAISSGSPNAWDFGLKSARIAQWSVGVQREIVKDVLFDVAYVGTRGNHLIGAININQSFPGPGAQGPRRPFFQINPLVTNINLRTNYGDSKYHALQVRLEKRYSYGLTGTLAYTWSKYMADVGNLNGGGNGPPQDARCYGCEWGPEPEDHRHILVVNHVYELPFGTGRQYLTKGWLGQLAGPWNVSAIWTLQTGDHFTPALAAAVSNSAGGGAQRPDRIADGNLAAGARSIDHWFDTGAFIAPPQYSFGNAGRGILVGPGLFNIDLGIHRDFRITERFALSYRLEMFNSLNHPNFSSPAAVTGNATAGQISGAGPARIIQMALKLRF
ncbi:MAG: carboxypeptidase regulatory-like domain-containing protein [Acidobacteriota bacterium]|nr:carboxypeptidase regulatory-like domain-containing protein [Acidobacteriota bacterium]